MLLRPTSLCVCVHETPRPLFKYSGSNFSPTYATLVIFLFYWIISPAYKHVIILLLCLLPLNKPFFDLTSLPGYSPFLCSPFSKTVKSLLYQLTPMKFIAIRLLSSSRHYILLNSNGQFPVLVSFNSSAIFKGDPSLKHFLFLWPSRYHSLLIFFLSPWPFLLRILCWRFLSHRLSNIKIFQGTILKLLCLQSHHQWLLWLVSGL